jgi:cobalt-zinc-cadmium efflux system outer membrane protein
MVMNERRVRLGGAVFRGLIPVAALVAAPLAAQPVGEVEAVDAALAQGDFAALGEAERAAAEARVRAIPIFDNPEASMTRERVSGSAGESETQIGVTQPIDISGRRASLRQAARAESRAVSADVNRRRQERIAETREAYAGCAASTDKAAIAERFVVRLREAERVVDLRTRAGDTAGYDLRRLRVEARSAEAELRLAQGEVNAQCMTLARLTGLAGARPNLSLAAMLPASPATAAARAAASSRQDILAREARVEAAVAEVSAAQRARIPDLSVGLGYKRISNDEGSAGGPTVALGVRLPVFNNGGAALAEARARQRVREAELRLERRKVEASIEAAAARAAAATEAALEAREAADDAARLGTIAEAAYQGGETGVVELVDAYRTARDAELNIVELAERAVKATVAQSLAEGRE